MRRLGVALTALLALAATAFAAAPAQRAHLLVIVGAAGDPVYEEVFHNWAVQIVEAAGEHLSMAPEQITYLGANPDNFSDNVAARSSRDNVEAQLNRLAREAAPDDRVFVVLIGHGSGEGEQSKFNIPGRDLSAIEYDALLDRFVTQQVGFINTASASGDFIAVLAAPNRVVVTATRDAYQNNQTVFPRFFAQAFSAEVSDLDKDGRVSLLEAYNYATLEVKRFYEDDGRMLTETAMLDDNADGEGSHEPTGGEVDGSRAGLLHLDNPLSVTVTDEGVITEDPELRALYEEQQQLRIRIEQLRQIKSTMDPDLYDAELEKLLVELALKGQQIRAKGGGR